MYHRVDALLLSRQVLFRLFEIRLKSGTKEGGSGMERIDVIYQAALALRKRLATPKAEMVLQGGTRAHHANELMEQLCDLLDIALNEGAYCNVMLGGAYSRLQLFDWSQPEVGGDIWLRPDMTPEKRAFAIAHELGHYILHRGEGQPLHPSCTEAEVDEAADPGGLRIQDHQVQEYTPRARRELEANAFAAELLAPRADVRRLFASMPQSQIDWLMAHFGISPTLVRQRLVDAIFSSSIPLGNYEATRPSVTTEVTALEAKATELLAQLDRSQREAACASTPALVIAGPGTGKTATLVGRVAHLIGRRGLQPEHILALTFSNRAAGEMHPARPAGRADAGDDHPRVRCEPSARVRPLRPLRT
jgi:Zn-dependent peptidase ImmA (M78 family)